MSNEEILPFQNPREPVAKKGVKLKRKTTELDSATELREQHQEDLRKRLDDAADKVVSQQVDRNLKTLELAKAFIGTCRDKTLSANKGVIAREHERELKNNLVTFAIEINNDPTEQYDGMGSIALINLLIKVAFEQRDRLNELEYQLAQMGKIQSSAGSSEPHRNG